MATYYDFNKTRYTSRDYDSIKQDLIDAIPSLTQEWTSREESDPGIVLIKLMAMFGDTLSYNIDKISLELYIGTVLQRKNCMKILHLLGYKMHWYRSGQVTAHCRLITDLDNSFNRTRMILTPWKTQFVAGNIRYTVMEQDSNGGDIDIYSQTNTTSVLLAEGTPSSITFGGDELDSNNRFYFPATNVDEDHFKLTVSEILSSNITCTLTESLYLVSSTSVLYYEFNVDEYERPYIQLADNWDEITGTTSCNFTCTYLLSSGANGNISSNAFTKIYNSSSDSTASVSNLAISNLPNTTKYGTDEQNLDSYNSAGYDPDDVDDARKDSHNYVFTHDTLVTSYDYQKACKRLEGITVSKLVDAQVVLNDCLDLDDIVSRALDSFTKVYRAEVSLDQPEVTEINQYLLQYCAILYLGYKDFEVANNYYYYMTDFSSLWCLRKNSDDEGDLDSATEDVYNRTFWDRTTEFVGDGYCTSWVVGGPVSNAKEGLSVTLKVTLNEEEIHNFDYEYDGDGKGILTMYYQPPTEVHNVRLNTEDISINITHLEYEYDERTRIGVITIIDNAPEQVISAVVNDDAVNDIYSYNEDTDEIIFNEAPKQDTTIKITKIYQSKTQKITLTKDAPDMISLLYINGEEVTNFDYSTEKTAKTTIGTIGISYQFDTIENLNVNGIPWTDFTLSNETSRMISPGYYPYKPTSNILLSVTDLIQDLHVLTVELYYGTLKLFPFTVQGILHLIEAYSPAETLEVVDLVDDELDVNYYPDLHDVGERPDFIEIVDIIQECDNRIKYFDAIDNIVVWAPEVQNRIDDFDEIFDTTSAIRYNGLNKNFNLDKRNLKFKLKNVSTILDSDEQQYRLISGTDADVYDVPFDWGTAYLINYSTAAYLPHIVEVDPDTYITLQLNNVQELRGLVEDMTYRGTAYITYVRHKDNIVTNAPLSTSSKTYDVETFTATGSQYEFTSTFLDSSVNNEFILIANGTTLYNGTDYTYDIVNNSYVFTVKPQYRFTGDGTKTDFSNTNLKNATILSVTVDDDEVEYAYNPLTGVVQITGEVPEQGAVIVITATLQQNATLTIRKTYYLAEFYPNTFTWTTQVKYEGYSLYSMMIEDGNGLSTEYKSEYFEDPSAGLINDDINPDELAYINNYAEKQGIVYFKFNDSNPKVYVNYYEYTDEIDKGQVLQDDEDYVTKFTYINNNGLVWIEEN